jgi:DNA polymerase III sliding clamp (beta) subunit (PCNA family)
MVVKREVLLDTLKQCLPGIEKGNVVLEGADTFILSGGFIYTYNDNISVRVPIVEAGLGLDEPIEGAVKASEFFSVVSKLPGEEIQLSGADKKWVIKSGKAKVELNLMEFDYSPRLKGIDPGEKDWQELHKDFQMAVGLCKMNGNRHSLSGIYVNGDVIASTDGWLINKAVIGAAKLPMFWINDPAASEVLKLIGLKELKLKDSWAHFKTDKGVVFSVRTLQADKWPMPKLDKIIDAHKKEKGDIEGVFPKELFAAVDRASSFSMEIEDYSTVRLTLSQKNIEVEAERTSGKYTEKVAWETPLTEKFTPIILYVDTQMMTYASRRSMGFYIHSTEKKGVKLQRLILQGKNSIHLLSTFQPKSEE